MGGYPPPVLYCMLDKQNELKYNITIHYENKIMTIIFGKPKFELIQTTMGDFLDMRKTKPDGTGPLINYKTIDPTPKGQRLNYKNIKAMQQIMIYPLIGLDMPKFIINKVESPVKQYNLLTGRIELMFFESRDGGGRTSTFNAALLSNHIEFPMLDDIEEKPVRDALRKMKDVDGQLVYKHFQGKTIADLQHSYPDLWDVYMNYPLTVTVYEADAPYKIAFNFTNTIKVPTDYTKLASSDLPVVDYLLNVATPDFRLGPDSAENKSLLPLFSHTWQQNMKTGEYSVTYDYLNLDGENNNGFEHALKMYYLCTNIYMKKVKSIREFKPLTKENMIAYANDEDVSDSVKDIFEETCNQVCELIKEIQKINENKKTSTKFHMSAVMARTLLCMILELKSRFKGNHKINYKKLADKVYKAYVKIISDYTLINQSQVLMRKLTLEFRSRNSAFRNYAGKSDVVSFAWCVEQLLIEMLDYKQTDYGLSDMGINVKDKRGILTKEQQLEIMKKCRNVDGDLVSAISGKVYTDESKLEFAHLYAIGLGKYIFSDAVDEIHNIVLVERILNRTMGQMSVYAFKEEYDKDPEVWQKLLNTD